VLPEAGEVCEVQVQVKVTLHRQERLFVTQHISANLGRRSYWMVCDVKHFINVKLTPAHFSGLHLVGRAIAHQSIWLRVNEYSIVEQR